MDYKEIMAKRMAEAKALALTYEAKKPDKKKNSVLKNYEDTDLWDIKGVWEETMKKLFENEIYTIEDVKRVWEKGIEELDLPFFSKRSLMFFLREQ